MKEKFTLFWDGPFSQWYPSPFTVHGVGYNCAEQFMMAEKARLFGDKTSERAIMAAARPSLQKAIGREVKNFAVGIWQREAKLIVYRGNYAKFQQNDDLLPFLLNATGTIVEASPEDTIWGIGLAEDNPEARIRSRWRGLNWLGEILTMLRDDLQYE